MKQITQSLFTSAVRFVARYSLSVALAGTTWDSQTTVDFEGLSGMTAWSYNPVRETSKLSNKLVSTYGTVFTRAGGHGGDGRVERAGIRYQEGNSPMTGSADQ